MLLTATAPVAWQSIIVAVALPAAVVTPTTTQLSAVLVADVSHVSATEWVLLPGVSALDTRAGVFYLGATAKGATADAAVLGWSTHPRSAKFQTPIVLAVPPTVTLHSILFVSGMAQPGVLAMVQRHAAPRLIDLLGTSVVHNFSVVFSFEAGVNWFGPRGLAMDSHACGAKVLVAIRDGCQVQVRLVNIESGVEMERSGVAHNIPFALTAC
jgi:hypothetical protein